LSGLPPAREVRAVGRGGERRMATKKKAAKKGGKKK
jgi:hypothetical protein